MPSDIAEVETPFESLVDEECFPDSASSVNDREFGLAGLDAEFSLPKVVKILRFGNGFYEFRHQKYLKFSEKAKCLAAFY